MSRVLKDASLSASGARAKLKRGAVHWRVVASAKGQEIHLGYRRSKRGGEWLARWRVGKGYKQAPLAAADDLSKADGDRILTYDQAERRARRHVEDARTRMVAQAAGPIQTVRAAVESYLESREAKGGDAGNARDARLRLSKHVLSDPALADAPIYSLTADDLQNWLKRLSRDLAPSTVRRLCNDLRAALNDAKADRDAVRDGLKAKGARGRQAVAPGQVEDSQILPTADIVRIVGAAIENDAEDDWGGDLARLVIVLAATGARFSQVRRMRVADVLDNALMVPASRKGQEGKSLTPIRFPVSPDVIAALRPALAGRRAGDVLLLRPRWEQKTPTVWTVKDRAPWLNASELTRPWRAILARAKLPAGTIPYALRHSSIVAALRLNLPVRLVAAMHDTSAAMIERHYSKYIVDALSDLARVVATPLLPVGSGKVVPLRA